MERKGLKRPADTLAGTCSKIARLLNQMNIRLNDMDERLERVDARLSTFSTKLECPVCLEKLSSRRGTSSTTCGHVFCTRCIDDAIAKKGECPTCRNILNSTQVHELFLFEWRGAVCIHRYRFDIPSLKLLYRVVDSYVILNYKEERINVQ